MSHELSTSSKPPPRRAPEQPVIDVTPTMNIHTIVAVVLRLMALNFFLRIVVEISTPLLVFAGIYQRPADDAPITIGWGLVGGLLLGGILLWLLALPAARLVARGVPGDLSLDNLTLADCYSLAFTGVGLVYIVSHLAGVWNWTMYFLRWIFHRQYIPWSDPNRGSQIMSIFIPFIAGIVMVLLRNKWARTLAGTNTHSAAMSFNSPSKK
ncbi:MAG TPA: hypothetical protein VGI88_01170 [Verrucomicrobiae bacterium]